MLSLTSHICKYFASSFLRSIKVSSCRSIKHKSAIQALRKIGIKVTRPREAVIDAFCQCDKPLNHKDIYEYITTKGETSTDLTSVYRTVEILKKNSLIHELQGGGYLLCEHSECETKTHVLTICTECRSSLEVHIPESIIGPTHWYLREHKGFSPHIHHIQIDGICEQCQTQEH